MNAEELTRALAGRWHSSCGTACCPSHKDRTPSLSVRDGDGGRLLTHCHAGCSPEAIWGALRDRGLVGGENYTRTVRGLSRHRENSRLSRRRDTSDRGRSALDIWRASRDPIGTVTAAYLHHRGITGPIPASIRDHLGLKHGPTGVDFPAMVGAIIRRVFAALPGLAIQAADLETLGRVDPMQAYPLAVHLNGIAVDHRGDACHVGQGRGGEQAQGDGEGAHGYSVLWLGKRKAPPERTFQP